MARAGRRGLRPIARGGEAKQALHGGPGEPREEGRRQGGKEVQGDLKTARELL